MLSGDQAESLLAAHGHCFQSAAWQMGKTIFLRLGISSDTHRSGFGSGSGKSPCSLKGLKISWVRPGSGLHVLLAQRQLFVAALFSDCTPSSSPGSRAGCSRTWAHTASSDSCRNPTSTGSWAVTLSPFPAGKQPACWALLLAPLPAHHGSQVLPACLKHSQQIKP